MCKSKLSNELKPASLGFMITNNLIDNLELLKHFIAVVAEAKLDENSESSRLP